MPRPILKVSDVCKTFHKSANQESTNKVGWQAMWSTLLKNKQQNRKVLSFNALQEISFSVSSGKSLGIIGLNGSGKTTLLQIIAGTLQPTKGHVYREGRITALLELGSGFNPDFTGIENIYLSASLHGLETHQIDSRLEKIIEFADIGDFISQPLRTYSSGMGMRLAFSVAAHLDTDIFIIDEALSVGDARFQIKCFSFLRNFQKKGGSLILVSHDLNSIATLCESSILLHRGKLVRIDSTVNVINYYSKIISEGSKISKLNSAILVQDQNEPQENRTKIISYGGELGQLNSVSINNLPKAVICAGEEFCISFTASSYSEIKKPIFALRIRDSKGQEIYGTNTKLLNITTPKLKSGDTVRVKFIQRANLGVGKFFISVGFTYFEGNDLKVVHRLRECLEFEVFNEDGSFGISNCFSRASVFQILK